MTAEFVKLMVRGEKRTLDMISPVDRAWDALWALAIELPKSGLVWEARPVDSLDLRAEVPQ